MDRRHSETIMNTGVVTLDRIDCWQSEFVYKVAVLGCTTLSHFTSYRNLIWMELGNTDRCWRVLAEFSKDVIAAMVVKKDAAYVRKQEAMIQEIIDMNAAEWREGLKQVSPGSSRLVPVVFKQR